MWMLLLATAWAEEPKVWMDSGTVHAEFQVAAPADDVRKLIGDPVAFNQVVGGNIETKILGQQGPCQRAAYHVPHPIATVDYTLDLCPTNQGYEAKLVEGPFTSYSAQWTVEPAGDGQSKVAYELSLASSMPVPSFVVNRTTKNSVHDMALKLLGHFKRK